MATAKEYAGQRRSNVSSEEKALGGREGGGCKQGYEHHAMACDMLGVCLGQRGRGKRAAWGERPETEKAAEAGREAEQHMLR